MVAEGGVEEEVNLTKVMTMIIKMIISTLLIHRIFPHFPQPHRLHFLKIMFQMIIHVGGVAEDKGVITLREVLQHLLVVAVILLILS